MQSFIRLGHHDGKIVWPRYGSSGAKCLFQEHNVILSNSGTESGADNLAIACLRSYSLSCTATLIVFTTDTTARYALSGHRTCNLTIIIRRSIRLSHAASLPYIIKCFLFRFGISNRSLTYKYSFFFYRETVQAYQRIQTF